MDVVRDLTLVAATLTTGMMAGVFALYSHTVMPALRGTDDRTFVAAFQAIDRAIINPWFLATFLGAPTLTGMAALAHTGTPALPWIVAAFALDLAALLVTIRVNVPLNDAIKAAGPVEDAGDLAAVRDRFGEARWAAWNHARTLATVPATALLAIAPLSG